MTTNPDAHAHTPLGAGTIVAESFSIFFRNLIPIMILSFVPAIFAIGVNGAVLGWSYALGDGDPELGNGFMPFILVFVVQIAVYGLIIALLVQLAYDAKLGRPLTIGRYFSLALRTLLPVCILMVVSYILMSAGFLLLVIPGLWIFAVFSVLVPAIVIEGVGFGGMGRSAQLTKEYRWPILGVLLLVLICTLLISFVVIFSFGFIVAALGAGIVGIGVALVLNAFASSIMYGLSAISVSLIYARLREIKEGVSVDKLAAVFD